MLHDEYPVKSFRNAQAFEKWLAKNHVKENGIWIKIAKANTGIATISYMEAIDVVFVMGGLTACAAVLMKLITYRSLLHVVPRANGQQ